MEKMMIKTMKSFARRVVLKEGKCTIIAWLGRCLFIRNSTFYIKASSPHPSPSKSISLGDHHCWQSCELIWVTLLSDWLMGPLEPVWIIRHVQQLCTYLNEAALWGNLIATNLSKVIKRIIRLPVMENPKLVNIFHKQCIVTNGWSLNLGRIQIE